MTKDEFDQLLEQRGIDAAWRVAQLVAAAEREACIKILEAYQIPVGNSAAGEMAAEWTYDALHSIRAEIKERGKNDS